jgi:hypothetical protein
MKEILNPVCSEAVFRLGARKFCVNTAMGDDIEKFFRKIARMNDATLEKYEFLDNEGGGADVDFVEGLIDLRLELGKEAFRGVPVEALWNEAVLVIGRGFRISGSPGQLLSALLEEGTSADIAVLRGEEREIRKDIPHQIIDLYREYKRGKKIEGKYSPPSDEKLAKICDLFQRWKRGEITSEEFRAEGLSCCFEEKEL